ncbi:hypothetical protein FACS189490_08660 [Clostridia bacterium]|nr:hypothetical protein FACS189490_08660 [Clostridia bacterium]
MSALNQMEVNAIREIVCAHHMAAQKLSDYETRCQDTKIRDMFSEAAQEAKKSAKDLTDML